MTFERGLLNDWVLHLVNNRKMKKVALMIESAAWTKPIAETMKKRLKDAGTEIPVFEYFYKEAKDFTPILTKAVDNKSDMIFFISAHVDASAFLTQWADMKGPILTGIVIGYSTLWKDSEGKVLSMSMQSSLGILGLTPQEKPFCEKYLKKYNSSPEYTSPNTYDAMYILKAAIERAKSTEPETLTDALEKTDYEGLRGRWVFEKSHHSKYGPGYRQLMIIQWQKDGKMCIVWPENIKTCEFILPPWYEKK
ncbi:MAG: ABC transporter substrate-binding protein [Desulfococcaceae bacterium]